MKKRILCLIAAVSLAATGMSQFAPPHSNDQTPVGLNYFLPEGSYSLDAKIPTPESVLGFQIGEQHVDWNDVLKYMEALDAASDKVSIKQFGRTYQRRPYIQVTITSDKNQKNLDQLRTQHLQLTDADKSGQLDIGKMPVVVNLMFSIHGNEPSGVNSSLAIAYYLAAAQGATIDSLLDNTIVVITPGLNPDGINRFASWVNSSRSFPDVADLNSREFSEPWPSSRTNHYWADCNRDWLMAQHPEGQNALEMYYEWMPNVVNDHHEQGGDGKGFYFSPGHPLRTHPLTPQLNQDLTMKIGRNSAAALDGIGSFYYSKEGYDDYYYGKGAAYGDMQGSVCILLEQVSSRGHLRPTSNGPMSFAYTTRNQSLVGIATVFASWRMKNDLLAYQRDYFKNSAQDVKKDPVQGYVFNTRGSDAIAWHFLDNMKRHRIDVYKLAKKATVNGHAYAPQDSYVIPADQKSYVKIKAIMENITEFKDSTFYDISTWTFPHAFNLQYAPLKSTAGMLGDKVTENPFKQGKVIGGMSEYAYIFENKAYYTPRMIAELLRNDLIVRVISKPFTWPNGGDTIRFGYGTLAVPIQNQPMSAEKIFVLMEKLSKECGVEVYSTPSGLMSDFDLGSPGFTAINLPKIAMVVGSGMSIPNSGEIWMMLDQRFNIPPVLIESSKLSSVDLNKYDVVILANGTPTRALSAATLSKLKNWVSDGGVLIATGEASLLTNKADITHIKLLPTAKADSVSGYKPYASRIGATAGNSVDGVILNCRLDVTHPLGWGYDQDEIAVMRLGSRVFKRPSSPYATPLSYTKSPYLSGCISAKNLKRIAGSPAIITESCGSGCAIVIADDLNFRSYWFGTTKLFMNAVLFGQLL